MFSRWISPLTHQSGIVALPEPGDGFAGVLQVVELPLRHGVPDQVFGPSGVIHLPALVPFLFLGSGELSFFLGRHAGGADGVQFGGTFHPAPERATRSFTGHVPTVPGPILDNLPSSIQRPRASFNNAQDSTLHVSATAVENPGTLGLTKPAGPKIVVFGQSGKGVRPMAEHYASGVWHVRQGNDEQFVQKVDGISSAVTGELPVDGGGQAPA